jgi:hypothetical protein
MLQQRQSKWKHAVNEWIKNFDWECCNITRFSFEDSSGWAHDDAVRGFYILGPVASSALPALGKLINDPDIGLDASQALAGIGPVSAPLLFAACTNSNAGVRLNVIRALTTWKGNIPGLNDRMLLLRTDTNGLVARTAIFWLLENGEESRRVDVIHDALKDGRTDPVGAGLAGLKMLGPQWTNALPDLLQLMNSPDQMLRARTSNVIKKLDPVLAASIGINTNVAPPSTNALPGRGRRGGFRRG